MSLTSLASPLNLPSQDFIETKSDQDFINDTELDEPEESPLFGRCLYVIDEDEEGNEERCNNLCNPAEQLCKQCRRFCG